MSRRIERPRYLDRMIDDIVQLADEVRKDYPWVYGIAYGSGGGGDDAKVQRGDAPDPTGGVIGSTRKENVRREAARASGQVVTALGALRKAAAALARAQDDSDPRPTIEPTRYARTSSPDELVASQAAQVRRRERGEDFGEG